MITIKLIKEVSEFGEVNKPETQLTEAERLTVTSSVYGSEEVIYYQGDEPIIMEE